MNSTIRVEYPDGRSSAIGVGGYVPTPSPAPCHNAIVGPSGAQISSFQVGCLQGWIQDCKYR